MSYVDAGYAITVVALAAYTARMLLRGRALLRALPSDDAGERP